MKDGICGVNTNTSLADGWQYLSIEEASPFVRNSNKKRSTVKKQESREAVVFHPTYRECR